MFGHEFVVDKCAVWVKGDVSKLEAFTSICPVLTDELMMSAFALNFPLATPLKTKESDISSSHPLVHSQLCAAQWNPSVATRAHLAPAKDPKADPLCLRHNHIVPSAVLEAL